MSSLVEVHPQKRSTALIRSTIMTGLSSMVPIPFVDDILIRRTRKGIVHRILRSHSVDLDPSELRTYYDGPPQGCLLRAVGLVFTVVKKILKKMLRTVFFFLAVRRASLEMVETYLLGRILDRCLEKGMLKDTDSVEIRVGRMRSAFETTMKGADRRILAQSMRRAWGSFSRTGGLTRRVVSRFRKNAEASGSDELQPDDLPASEQDVIEESAVKIEESVKDTEVRKFLLDFDRRFDTTLASLSRPSSDTPD